MRQRPSPRPWLLPAAALLGACLSSTPRPQAPPSDHFDGEKFFNLAPRGAVGFGEVWTWLATRRPGAWIDRMNALPGPPPPVHVGEGRLRVTFVNHATLLVQMDGVNLLTDPIWSERASPVGFAGPARIRPPGIRFEDLPPIHAVVVSHNHYDHLDLETLRRLSQAHRPRLFVGLGNTALLASHGIDGGVDLDWWQARELVPGVEVIAVPAQHGSNRGLFDAGRTLWAGFVLKGPSGTAYFAGDTADGPHFAQVKERLGPPRLAMLPIGAFRPEWLMSRVHLSPQQAVEVHLRLSAKTSVGMHYGTFRLGDDGQYEPIEALGVALLRRQVPFEAFWALGFGEGRDVP
jgi:L-ascorbate metabolism protein UlaG (beta-lactamase superfamily)